MEYQWNQLCEVVEKLRPKIISRLVTWNMPVEGMIKINTDGSFMEQNGKAGIGGIARDGTVHYGLDSKVVTDLLRNITSKNLTLRPIIEDIIALTEGMDVSFTHCYREANMVADYLAKLATTLHTPLLAQNLNQLPNKAFGLYFLDKRQFPSVRLRYDKANFFVS
ncbi:hypothetical protein HAX54_016083 [Datura stramonium]|uniref:RNase H type-1 domain-containing protein n=1 Tax=Datura stramonium TaxID=4076 RepID=A0ABS8UKL8_DATST|nr:hypothetical protein [Datura stramonium]